MCLRLALVAAATPLVVAACGSSGSATHLLVYHKPVTLDGAGWIWRAAPDGSDARKLVFGYDPAVSPDGRWVAYHKVGGFQRITPGPPPRRDSLWVISSGGGAPRKIGQNQAGIWIVGWAPDSKHLLISDPAGLKDVDVAKRTETLVVRDSVYSASFSPDSRQIAYDRGVKNGSAIFVVSANGGPSRRLTHNRWSISPVWGPQAIAYCRCEGNTYGDIWLMDADGSHQRNLTHTGAALNPAAWSRDGRRLLADYPPSNNGQLWAVDVPSGDSRALTEWVGDLFPQGLSPDGKTVYAAIGCGGRAGDPEGVLETIPFAGGPAKVIVQGPCRGSWSS